MAGHAKNKPTNEMEKLRNEVRELRSQLAESDKVAARVDPQVVLSRMPEPLEDYEEDLPERVLSRAMLGMFPRDIRAELAITAQQWSAWRTAHNRFYNATSRAKDIAAAYWQRLAREALTAKDWKFPYSQMQTMIKNMQEDDEDVDRGDASALVVMNVAKGRKAMDEKAGKPGPVAT